MLLVLDIGNTNMTFGLFKGAKLIKTWRCVTKKVPRIAELEVYRSASKVGKVEGMIVSSVVPEIDSAVRRALKKRFGVSPMFVTYRNAGVKIGYPRPKEIGADRLVDAVAAWKTYNKACVIVDLGTAATLDYVDGKGTYMGGSIAPGINLASKALYDATSKLPKIKIKVSKRMLPKTTIEAMQTGVYQGYIGLIERLVKMTLKEVGGNPVIIATGGLAPLILKGTGMRVHHEPYLTLHGLRLICSRQGS